MAVQDIKNGTDYVVFIDTVTPITSETPPLPGSANWRMIMCLNTNAINVTVDSIDTTTKCTGGWADAIPGDASWEITADGAAVDTDGPSEASFNELLSLTANKESFWAAIFDGERETWRMGVVYISSYGESFDRNTMFGFTSTLTGRGQLYFNEATT